MLETGQPTHAFDFDKLSRSILIRFGKKQEKIKNIHNKEIEISEKDLIAISGNNVIDLMGITGSKDASINDNTKNVLIECALLNSEKIKDTSKRLGISTSASKYFSNEYNSIFGSEDILRRIFFLLKETSNCQEEKFALQLDKKEIGKESKKKIFIDREFIETVIGREFKTEEISEILRKNLFEFVFLPKGETFCVTIPFFRSDLKEKNDLIKEILKIYDCNKIEGSMPSFQSFLLKSNEKEIEKKNEIRKYLVNLG
jgi:phenylalanyl-tRNA synthetase beta chain